MRINKEYRNKVEENDGEFHSVEKKHRDRKHKLMKKKRHCIPQNNPGDIGKNILLIHFHIVVGGDITASVDWVIE
jgi:hypothetical protein